MKQNKIKMIVFYTRYALHNNNIRYIGNPNKSSKLYREKSYHLLKIFSGLRGGDVFCS